MRVPTPDADGAMEPGGTAVAAVSPAATGETGFRRSLGQVLKDIALFLAAPFVTLAYLPLFPFIGIALLRQARRHGKAAS